MGGEISSTGHRLTPNEEAVDEGTERYVIEHRGSPLLSFCPFIMLRHLALLMTTARGRLE